MKNLLVVVEKTQIEKPKFVTKSETKKDVKNSMNLIHKRLDTIVSLYFESSTNEVLRSKIKGMKLHNGLIDYIDCFESSDQSKFVSFISRISSIPFVTGISFRNLSVNQFSDLLVDICTVKNGTSKKLKIEIVDSENKSPFCERENVYEIEVSFSIDLVKEIFKLYM